MSTWLILILSIFNQLKMRDVIIYGLIDEKITRHRPHHFRVKKEEYHLSKYLDCDLKRDIGKNIWGVRGYPSIQLKAGVGSSPSGNIALLFQTDPSVYFGFLRSNNPIGHDCLRLNVCERNYGSFKLTHDCFNRHFTHLSISTGVEKFRVEAFSTWLETLHVMIVRPILHDNIADFSIMGQVDFGSEFNYHLQVRYFKSPFSLGINFYNPLVETPLFVRPELYFTAGGLSVYFKSAIANLYLNDVYKLHRFSLPRTSVREKINFDLGVDYQGISFGYISYESLPYFNRLSPDPGSIYSVQTRPARFGYIKVHRFIGDFEILGKFEQGTEVPNRNQAELGTKYSIKLGDYRFSPKINFYYRDEIKHRLDLYLERNFFGILELEFGIINIFDQSYVQPENFIKKKREFFGKIGASL